jgi:hypothetical protein
MLNKAALFCLWYSPRTRIWGFGVPLARCGAFKARSYSGGGSMLWITEYGTLIYLLFKI